MYDLTSIQLLWVVNAYTLLAITVTYSKWSGDPDKSIGSTRLKNAGRYD